MANEELPEYPAFDKSATANDVTVHATAQEGVLSLGAHLVAKQFTKKAILNAVKEKVEKDKTPKAEKFWALINLISTIVTVLFGLLLLISKRHKSEDEEDETEDQSMNNDEEKEQEKKRGLFTHVLAVLIAIASIVFFLVTEDISLDLTWTIQYTIWMVVLGIVQIVVFFIGRKWKNVDNDEDDEQA